MWIGIFFHTKGQMGFVGCHDTYMVSLSLYYWFQIIIFDWILHVFYIHNLKLVKYIYRYISCYIIIKFYIYKIGNKSELLYFWFLLFISLTLGLPSSN